MYYNIEVINNNKIDFIVIVLNITQSLTHNSAGILVLNSDPDSHFFSICAEQAQNIFWNLLKIKSPQQEKPGKLSWNAPSKGVNTTYNLWFIFNVMPGGRDGILTSNGVFLTFTFIDDAATPSLMTIFREYS